jgi:Domain of unknown function (DUF5655)
MPDKPLWTCPVCGQRYVTRNMPHSCQVVALDEFFAGAAPEQRELFERFVAAARESGTVTVNATKSRIALQARMRFAGIQRPRRRYLLANFVLTRPVESPRLARVEFVPPYYYVHKLRLSGPEDVDAELRGWLAEAYEVGEQRHVRDPGWQREREPPDWVHVPSPYLGVRHPSPREGEAGSPGSVPGSGP